MIKSPLLAGACLLLTACAQSYGPPDVRALNCHEIQAAQGALDLERKALGLGSLLGSIAVAVTAGPWVALPVVLAPSFRGDRGEFALGVAEVLRQCAPKEDK